MSDKNSISVIDSGTDHTITLFSLEFGFVSLTDQFISDKESMLFLDFLFEFLKLDEQVQDKRDFLVSNNQKYTFEFINVSFKYPGSEHYYLKDINLKISTGESVCLIGENGNRKSTLVKLLMRIYEPSDGCILINSIDGQLK